MVLQYVHECCLSQYWIWQPTLHKREVIESGNTLKLLHFLKSGIAVFFPVHAQHTHTTHTLNNISMRGNEAAKRHPSGLQRGLCLHIRAGLCSRDGTVPYSWSGTSWQTQLFAVHIVPLITGAFTFSPTDAHTWPVFVTWAMLRPPASRGRYSWTADCPWEQISAFVKYVYPFSHLPPLPLSSLLFLYEKLSPVCFPFLFSPPLSGERKEDRDRGCETVTERSKKMERGKRKLPGSNRLWC